MTEDNQKKALNQDLYHKIHNSLQELEVPEHLADAVSRIIATDDGTKPNAGRNEIDNQLCGEVAKIVVGKRNAN